MPSKSKDAAAHEAGAVELGLREMMSYAIPGGSGMRNKRCVVGARCGENNLVEEFTHRDTQGGNNPTWEKHHHSGRVLHLKRHVQDKGVGVVTLHQVHKEGAARTWVGGNHFKFSEAVRSPHTEFEKDVPLYVSGTPQGGAGSGILSIKFKWVPAAATTTAAAAAAAAFETPTFELEDSGAEQQQQQQQQQQQAAAAAAGADDSEGELVVTVLKASGLVMPDRIVRDLTTHVDTTPVILALVLMSLYLLTGLGFYMAMGAGGRGKNAPFLSQQF